jgi:SAM-dependent methyltransferase
MCSVIGPRYGPPSRDEFGVRWGAPGGHNEAVRFVVYRLGQRLGSLWLQAKAIGPFGFQYNNATRVFEYPWAYGAVPLKPHHTVIDLGGSLGGFQFVLASTGARVINVDPGEAAAKGWKIDTKAIATLNRAFGTHVELRNTFLEDAGFDDDSVDRIYCISTAEHIPAPDLKLLASEIKRILRPGGYAVFTVDLFYDLAPFTTRKANSHGRNIDIREFVDWTGLTLEQGDPSQLCGYKEFDPEGLLASADEHIQGNLALNTAQAFVLAKEPTGATTK